MSTEEIKTKDYTAAEVSAWVKKQMRIEELNDARSVKQAALDEGMAAKNEELTQFIAEKQTEIADIDKAIEDLKNV